MLFFMKVMVERICFFHKSYDCTHCRGVSCKLFVVVVVEILFTNNLFPFKISVRVVVTLE